MGFIRGSALAIALLGMAGQAFAQSNPTVVLPVLVYNYASISNAALHSAQRQAGRIFHESGVAFEWHSCRVSTSRPQKDPDCSDALGRAYLVLKILPRSELKVFPVGKDVMGFVPSGDMVSDAYVFYDRLYDMARQESADVADLLGSIVAHEFGHLLAGSGMHSAQGVMRAEWTGRSLSHASLREMKFSLEQRQRIYLGALSRVSRRDEHSRPAADQNQE
jgi:hypothetical protein